MSDCKSETKQSAGLKLTNKLIAISNHENDVNSMMSSDIHAKPEVIFESSSSEDENENKLLKDKLLLNLDNIKKNRY